MKRLINAIMGKFGYMPVHQQLKSASIDSGFSESLLEKTVFNRCHPEAGLSENELYKIFRSFDDIHKWHHYFPIYTSKFERFRDKPIRMLEIGVQRGGSLKMWKKWFHPEAVIVGLDVNPVCQKFDNPDDNLFVRIGDQTDDQFLGSVIQEFGPFDIILDDGGHTTGQMTASFNSLFRKGLKEDGLYLVEDTHSNYVSSFIDTDTTFVDLCKTLIDIMHEHYVIAGLPSKFRVDIKNVLSELEVPYLTAWVNSVEFYDSIIAIEKKRRVLPSNECLYR